MNALRLACWLWIALLIGCGGGARVGHSGSDSTTAAADTSAQPHSVHNEVDLDPAGATAASVQFMAESLPSDGFEYCALEVNFPNGAWAHGGLQNSAHAGQTGNWGGLVSLGYAYQGHELEVLEQIQNLPGRTTAVSWQPNTWYQYDIAQVGPETLPPGNYSVLDDAPVYVDHPRNMWRWTFTVTSLVDGSIVWQQAVDVAASDFTGWSYWTETGYGFTCQDVMTVHWDSPRFAGQLSGWASPTRISKSIYQSTCSAESTTDMSAESPDQQGTTIMFGVPRPRSSTNGQPLYQMPGDIGTRFYALGGAQSIVGFPISDEQDTACATGRQRLFERGEIITSSATGAFESHGPILDAWNGAGSDCSGLGLPTSDVQVSAAGAQQQFQAGSLSWNAASGQTTISQP